MSTATARALRSGQPWSAPAPRPDLRLVGGRDAQRRGVQERLTIPLGVAALALGAAGGLFLVSLADLGAGAGNGGTEARYGALLLALAVACLAIARRGARARRARG